MQFKTSLLTGTLAAITSAFVSSATPIIHRDVYVPRITSPNVSTVWTAGSAVNVTWDISDVPARISNRAAVQLNRVSTNLGKLAQDFDLRAGFVTVTVPDVDPAPDYSVTLFGDSGNRSPNFSVIAPVPVTGKSKRFQKFARDVWSPRITSPTAGTVWVAGGSVNVTWDTSDKPLQISNGAAVLLNKDGYGQQFLKEFRTFDLTSGLVELTVPEVEPGNNYSITLFGDSGNESEKFTITTNGDDA